VKIASVFNVAAKDYDATRKKYITCFDDFYGVAIEQIPFSKSDTFKVLDLGAGTGLFSSLVKELFPNCEITLTDISDEMLDKARIRFKGHENIHFIQNDYINEPIPDEYDIVISALSLHHSTSNELKSIFGKLFICLKSGGIFINADQILGRTPEIEKVYEASWLEQAKAKNCTNEEIEVALKRIKSDKTLPLSEQLNILDSVGFKMINCWYQYYRYAVYSGTKCT
jgi:tRNA (cmo5U34)-methyltransferase